MDGRKGKKEEKKKWRDDRREMEWREVQIKWSR